MKSLLVVTGALFALCANGFSQERIAPQAPSEPEKASAERPRVRYVTRPVHVSPEGALHANATVATVPTWSTTSGTYTYQMVGGNPASSNATTTIAAPVIPLILTFSDGTVMDPTASNACSSTAPTTLMQASPLFNNTAWTVGGTTVGTTTYHDFYQRANFWQYTQPSGSSPNFHMLLTSSTGTPVKITVPAADGSTVAVSCGKRALVNLSWLDSYLQTTAFTQLASNGVLPSQLPVFMMYNTSMYEGTTSDCCVLGYHSGFSNPNYSSAMQYYVVADFETTGTYGTTADTATFSHEIAEWMDDPAGNNPTPPWGNVGQVTGCQSNLEVGDPLSGTDITVTMSNSYTYHLQELAFVSWFYRTSPSIGVNGWYSSNGTFKTPAAACDATTTTLSISPTTLAAGGSATVTATITPSIAGEGTPTGSVALKSSTGATVATIPLVSGAASATVTTFPTGSYTVTAQYSGDVTFEASTSSAVTMNVGLATVSFSPTALTFASTVAGSSSAAQVVKLTNTGTAPLTGIAVSFSGASPSVFSQTNTCGTSVAAGASCNISVTFKPTVAGTFTATVSVADSGVGSPQTVALTGTATGTAAVTLSPASLSFGSVNTGSTSAAQTITVNNTGTAALTISSLKVNGTGATDFPTTTTCGTSLAAAASCTISVSFKPAAAGSFTASVSLADSATGSPQTVALTGTGVTPLAPAVTLSPTSLAFGSVTSGSSSALSVTITNSGTASLSITLPLTLSGSSVFTETTTCTATLAVNASCTATVTFKPTAKTSYNGTLSIADNASGSPQKVTLTGTGK